MDLWRPAQLLKSLPGPGNGKNNGEYTLHVEGNNMLFTF